MKITKTS